MDVSKPGKRFQTEGWSTLKNTPRHSQFQNVANTCVHGVGNRKRICVRGMVVEPTTRRSRIHPGQSRRAQIPIREASVYDEVNNSVRAGGRVLSIGRARLREKWSSSEVRLTLQGGEKRRK
jgi:hypothetical protein